MPETPTWSKDRIDELLRVHPVVILYHHLLDASKSLSLLNDAATDVWEKLPDAEDAATVFRSEGELRRDVHEAIPNDVMMRADKAINLLHQAAIGISQWLEYGVPGPAGPFETELRSRIHCLECELTSFFGSRTRAEREAWYDEYGLTGKFATKLSTVATQPLPDREVEDRRNRARRLLDAHKDGDNTAVQEELCLLEPWIRACTERGKC